MGGACHSYPDTQPSSSCAQVPAPPGRGTSAERSVADLPDVEPAPVLAAVVGVFHTGLYLLIRGSVGVHLPFVLVAAVLGAYGGQALGSRIGDPLMVGDFGLVWASVLAWLGIIVIAAAGVLAPSRDRL
jgi:hypothetical protein